MEVILNIKNLSKAIHPEKDNVIVYDGKQWYVTTKRELLKDAYKLIDECQKKLESLEKENKDFKVTISSQMVKMSELIKKLYEVEGYEEN